MEFAKLENEFCFINIAKGFKKGLNMFTNSKVFRAINSDPDLDIYAKKFLIDILIYAQDETKYGNNWTKSRAMKYFGYTKYRIDKIFAQLEKKGILIRHKIYPHAYNEEAIKSEELKVIDKSKHDGIYWISEFRFSFNNTPTEEMEEVSKNNIDLINEQLKKPAHKKPLEIETIDEDVSTNPLYQAALERYKNEYLLDTYYSIDAPEDIKTFCNDALNETGESKLYDDDLDGLAEICWNTIVKAQVYSDKPSAFNNFRYSEVGNKMASFNEKAIKQAFLKFRTFSPGESNLPLVNEYENFNKKFLAQCSLVIHNYIKLHFLNEKLPEYKEVLGLFKTLADHPELICLEYNEENYKILHYLFIKNQELYNKKE